MSLAAKLDLTRRHGEEDDGRHQQDFEQRPQVPSCATGAYLDIDQGLFHKLCSVSPQRAQSWVSGYGKFLDHCPH